MPESTLIECDRCGASVDADKMPKHLEWHEEVSRPAPTIVYRDMGAGTAAYEVTPTGLRSRPDLSTPPPGHNEFINAPLAYDVPPVEQPPRPQNTRRPRV